MHAPCEELERKLGHTFRNRELLVRALTHRSWVSEQDAEPSSDNEQLEFLGDSILGFVVSEALVERHASVREGQLSQWKSQLVSATHLHKCAQALDLGSHLRLGKGEERSGGRERKTVLANALEAIIAAIHLDAGIEPARRFVRAHVLHPLDHPESVQSLGLFNHKGALHERVQALGLPAPQYMIVAASGPDHAKVYTIEARVGAALVSRATGTSKKAASQQAAELLMEQLANLPAGK